MDIIVYFPTIQVISETVARQRKVIQAAPAFAVILPVFQTSVIIFIRVFSNLWNQFMNGKFFVYLKSVALEASTVVVF